MFTYPLRIGLPHTNYNQLTEYLLMMQAGYFQWDAIASSIGVPLSQLRSREGGQVYATFYYIETKFPESAPIHHFRLDDDVVFQVSLKSFKNISVQGEIVFDRADRFVDGQFAEGEHPTISMGNVFISPRIGNSALRVAPPANGSFQNLPKLPNEENNHNLVRVALKEGTLGLLTSSDWRAISTENEHSISYGINPDRDSNGAGLVYFANYFAFMDFGEREAMTANRGRTFSPEEIQWRRLRHRKIAYFGNADLGHRLKIEVDLFENKRSSEIGFRYRIRREHDGELICLSEAIKALV